MTRADALGFLLVFLIGFAAHRANLCTVRAVMQWIDEHKASVIISFIKAAAWTSLMAGVFVLLSLPIKGAAQTHGLWWMSLLGGFLFGVGAAINGGCSLSTLQQLADGDSSLLLTLMGFVAGIATTSAMENNWLPQATHASPLWWVGRTPLQHLLLVSLLSLWAVRELSVLWRRRDRCQSVWQRMAAPRYRLSFGALLLGVSSGLLFLIEGAWTYTNYLRKQTSALFFEGAATAWLRSALVLALLMGAGGAMLPGGNDTLILVLIPTLSIQAVASYMALLTGIACVLLMMRRRQ